MAKLILTKESLINPNDLLTLLESTTERGSALDDLLALLRELVAYEDEHGLTSDVFYARFMRGEMGDDLPFIMWAGQYESYLEVKQELTSRLADADVAV